MGFCQSCTAPLSVPEFQVGSDDYCKHCLDDDGALKPYEEVRQGIAGWFMGWQKGITPEVATERAAHFMRAMPAWADR